MRSNRSLLALLGVVAAAPAAATEFSGSLRLTPQWRWANDDSVLAAAAQRLGGGDDQLTTDLELRGSVGPLHGIATLRSLTSEGRRPSTQGVVNELRLDANTGSWYFTAGKKIVSWDVGHAFRPLDVVQQEDRRALVTTTLEGVPVLMAERFGAASAWSVVIANPVRPSSRAGRDESSIAVRAYWRNGAIDLHAVARFAEHSGWRGGGAFSWVATDSIEVHGSASSAQRLERAVRTASGYAIDVGRGGWQVLTGASWTGASKVSLLIELWHDERAWPNREWQCWRERAQMLAQVVPAGSLREQAIALEAGALGSRSLHRDNLLMRLSYDRESFSPSADVLYMPADRGTILTTRLAWHGARGSLEIGLRHYSGPRMAVVSQVPSSRIAYLSGSVSF